MKDDIKKDVIGYWMEKAEEALASARSEQQADRRVFAVNRAYYACFYALSAVLMQSGQTFRKHTGVRGALHRAFIKTGMLEASWGKFYDLIFENRQRGDYQELVEFEVEELQEIISQSEQFVEVMKELLARFRQSDESER